MTTLEQIKELGDRLEALKSYLNLEEKKIQIANEEEKTGVPEFWNDPKNAEVVLKGIRHLKFWVEGFEKLSNDFEELELAFEFAKEDVITEEELEKRFIKVKDAVEDLEFRNMLSGEEDK